MIEDKLSFWTKLRFEISNSAILEAYCDWIEPKFFYLDLKPALIEGKIGFLTPEMKEFKFRLTIDQKLDSINHIDSINLNQWMIEEDSSVFNENIIEINLIKK